MRRNNSSKKDNAATLGFKETLWQAAGNMRAFYLAWTEKVEELQQTVGEMDGENLPQVVGEIPWGHNLQLISKLEHPLECLWYAHQTIDYGGADSDGH